MRSKLPLKPPAPPTIDEVSKVKSILQEDKKDVEHDSDDDLIDEGGDD